MPPEKKRIRRYIVNPAEVFILGVMGSVFLFSAYHLIYDSKNGSLVGTRSIASPSRMVQTIPFTCPQGTSGSIETQTTQVAKVRLTGPICGFNGKSTTGTTKAIKTEVFNQANPTNSPVVFNDDSKGLVSTEYVDLMKGLNTFKIVHTDSSGKTVQHTIQINRE